MLGDLRLAARQLRRSPVVTAVAVLTLALGTGATTAVFSVVSALLLRPLPYPGGDAIVVLTEAPQDRLEEAGSTSYANVTDWDALSGSLEAVAVVDDWSPSLTGSGRPERLEAALVTAEIFDVLRVRPVLGRPILAAESRPGSEPVAVVSDGFWRRRLGADPSALGRTIRLSGVPRTVVGVLPRGFRGPAELAGEVWGNHVPPPGDTRDSRSLRAMGRLAGGATLEQARAEMRAISARLRRAHPAENAALTAVVTPLRKELAGDARGPLLVLLGAAATVLLVACANLSNVLLVRALDRRREFAIRAALGVTRWRLGRQALAESGLLAALGGAAGLLLAAWGTELLPVLGPPAVSGREIPVDVRVLGFAAAATILTVLLVGSLPALRGSRVDVVEGLRAGGRAGIGGATRARSALMVAQLSLAVALLAGAGLLLKSFIRLNEVDPGIRPHDVLTVSLSLPSARYPDGRIAPFFEDVLARIEGLPGVEAAGAVSTLPFSGNWDRVGIETGETPAATPAEQPEVDRYVVTPGYFAAMGVPLRRGRLLEDSDRGGSPAVALVDEVLARRLAPAWSPIGRRLRFSDREEPVTVVGVVGHVRHYGLDRTSGGQVYLPLAQLPWPWMSLVARTAGPPRALAEPIRRTVESVDPDQPVFGVATMEERLAEQVATRRFTTLLLAGFAALATAMAALGLYGVVAHGVARRQSEIGIRMALGATARRVLLAVLWGGLRTAAAGVALGLLAAGVGSRLLGRLLYGVVPTDPAVLGTVSLLLLIVAALASAIPAIRAARLDPAETLRNE